tara:strand:- start:1561 stop:1770 length:210 start_codon:yes stop_codon:yes gene_type:complete
VTYYTIEIKPKDNKMSDVKKVNFNTKFNAQEDLADDVSLLIKKYDGQLSLAQFIGVLEVVKYDLLIGHS